MKVITATPFLSKNTAFTVVCDACTSTLEMVPSDVFVDQRKYDDGTVQLVPLFNCPVCKSMVEITKPTIPNRVLELWLADQPV